MILIVLALLGAALGVPSTARATVGTIDLSWNACSPLVADINPAGPGPISFYASVTGQSDPHKSYSVHCYAGDVNDQLPDAWSFQAAGCQGSGRFLIDHRAPAEVAAACPTFMPNTTGFQIKYFEVPPRNTTFPATLGEFLLANAYPFNLTTPDPNKRYFLARFRFDHTASVPGAAASASECGGFERSVCFFVDPANCAFVNSQDTLVPFQLGQTFLTFRGECKSVPASNATWGQIKSQYRL